MKLRYAPGRGSRSTDCTTQICGVTQDADNICCAEACGDDQVCSDDGTSCETAAACEEDLERCSAQGDHQRCVDGQWNTVAACEGRGCSLELTGGCLSALGATCVDDEECGQGTCQETPGGERVCCDASCGSCQVCNQEGTGCTEPASVKAGCDCTEADSSNCDDGRPCTIKQIRYIYAQNDPSELLIVGHTDTTAEPDINDPLSKERANSLRDYLTDNVDAWLKNYDLPGKKKWGSHEDRLMIAAMPDFASRTEDEDIIEWFQRTREPIELTLGPGLVIRGGRLRLYRLGRGKSELKLDEAKPATLTFFAGFKAKERGVGDPEFKKFATLEGQVLAKTGNRAVFLVAQGAEFQFDEPAPSDGALARELEVRFDPNSFPNAPKDAANPEAPEGAQKPGTKPEVHPLTRLRLPSGPDDARFLEIAIELQVAGAIESSHLDNDRLDVPLREVVEIVLIDDDDDPIPGAKYEIRSGLTTLSGNLDGDGFARVEQLPVKHNKISFPEFAPATNVVPVPDEDVPAALKA